MKKRRKRKKIRKYKKRILIYCEGKTETYYFEGLRTSEQFRKKGAIDVQILSPNQNDALSLVKKAHQKKQEEKNGGNPFDMVWVVFDKDHYTKHKEAFAKAKKEKIEISFSSISFEYWFLLHFEKIVKPFSSSDEVIKHINDNHMQDYRKTNQHHYNRLKDKLDDALDNGQWLRDQKKVDYHQVNGAIYKLNPYVTVDCMINELLKM
ncbi:MAG: RloB family protein [Flavobacteriales bacterium]